VTQLPDKPRGEGGLPERRLSPEQFEAVIRRAAELQAKSADEVSPDGITQSELIRIGREIGISPQYVQRALAETGGPLPAEQSTAVKLFGPATVVASRSVPGHAEAVRAHLEKYLYERERLSAVRRFPDRTTYHPARGFDLHAVINVAQDALGGGKQPRVGAGFKLKRARNLEVAVQPLEEGYSYVTLRLDLGNLRTGFATGGVIGGTAGALGVGAVLGIAVDPAAAILGLPVIAGSLWGFRAIQSHTAAHAQTHLESLLDCLERGEPLVRSRPARP
jgi:hypothetical protein